jgi:hypothetical protein
VISLLSLLSPCVKHPQGFGNQRISQEVSIISFGIKFTQVILVIMNKHRTPKYMKVIDVRDPSFDYLIRSLILPFHNDGPILTASMSVLFLLSATPFCSGV